MLFLFKGRVYRRICDTPTGVKISIVGLYVIDFSHVMCEKLIFDVPCLKKYDDVVLAVHDDKQENVFDVFNSFNNHIQFTIETEIFLVLY